MLFDLEEELKKLPASPGVYLMHNNRDEIIYVGNGHQFEKSCTPVFSEQPQ